MASGWREEENEVQISLFVCVDRLKRPGCVKLSPASLRELVMPRESEQRRRQSRGFANLKRLSRQLAGGDRPIVSHIQFPVLEDFSIMGKQMKFRPGIAMRTRCSTHKA